jgi:Cu(I)/Ag(I) efflux system membrane fusion protein
VLSKALAAHNKETAAGAAAEALDALAEVDMGLVTGEAHDLWMSHANETKAALNEIKAGASIELMRKAFEELSDELIVVVGQLGIPQGKTLYKTHCPMAFDNKGADWLQFDEDILNPYFGASMLKCGEVRQVIGDKTE